MSINKFESLSYRVWLGKQDAMTAFIFSFESGKGKNVLYQFIASANDARDNGQIYVVMETRTMKMHVWKYGEDNASKRAIIIY